MNIARSKQYPANYPRDAVAILDAMSFTDGKAIMLLGSMSLRSQQYAGDYDAFERVNLSYSDERVATAYLAKKFKAIIKRLRSNPNAYIGDIKSGLIPEWRIIPETAVVVDGKVQGYNATACRKRVDTLLESGIITRAEAKDALALLKDSPSPIELLVARDTLKFHIVRWSALEVLQGHKKIRGGHTYTLEEAFNSPGLTKLDVIGFVENNRYTDFSCIYEFKNNDTILNPVKIDVVNSLKENILYYKATNSPFKALKREFALAKFKSDYKALKRLNPILNSDLGRIYAVQSDVGTLLALLEDHRGIPLKKIHFEIDQFKRRIASVYEIDEVIKAEPTIDGDIEAMTKMTRKAPLLSRLQSLYDKLQGFLVRHTPKVRGGGDEEPSGLRIRIPKQEEEEEETPAPAIRRRQRTAVSPIYTLLDEVRKKNPGASEAEIAIEFFKYPQPASYVFFQQPFFFPFASQAILSALLPEWETWDRDAKKEGRRFLPFDPMWYKNAPPPRFFKTFKRDYQPSKMELESLLAKRAVAVQKMEKALGKMTIPVKTGRGKAEEAYTQYKAMKEAGKTDDQILEEAGLFMGGSKKKQKK